jgi:hypothetical protein
MIPEQRNGTMSDWVAIGSYLSVAFSIVVLVFIVFKVKKLMDEDSKKH